MCLSIKKWAVYPPAVAAKRRGESAGGKDNSATGPKRTPLKRHQPPSRIRGARKRPQMHPMILGRRKCNKRGGGREREWTRFISSLPQKGRGRWEGKVQTFSQRKKKGQAAKVAKKSGEKVKSCYGKLVVFPFAEKKAEKEAPSLKTSLEIELQRTSGTGAWGSANARTVGREGGESFTTSLTYGLNCLYPHFVKRRSQRHQDAAR